MQAYGIKYHIRGKEEKIFDILVDAKNKIGKKHGYKDGRMIVIEDCKIIGYF